MLGLIQEPQFKHISIKETGTTFVAEIEGVGFSQDIPKKSLMKFPQLPQR
jgi:alpha-ketoglutarate-dependent 2,4-dichlorophenoxyacetate dioxygenase